jgi:hypothetical protein
VINHKPTESYRKVPYDLRTSKQIERRMILDALIRLSRHNFDIAAYQYTGMGSVHFVDYILLHRMLGIRRMLSAEYSTKITRRIQFNRPYRNIELAFKAIGDVIPDLSPDLRHLLWLDYDFQLNGVVTTDVLNAAAALSVGSFLLVTVDVEPPVTDGSPKEWRKYFVDRCAPFCSSGWPLTDFALSKLHKLNVRILGNAISSGLSGRENVTFHPLFNFSYADGHQMLTIGGVIGGDTEKRAIDACNFEDAVYLRRSLQQGEYVVPKFVLTRKEKLYLDAAMPRRKKWKPKDFEMDEKDLAAYAEVHRFYPSYAELFL